MLKDFRSKYRIYFLFLILTVLFYVPLNVGGLPFYPAFLVITVFYFSIIPALRPSLIFLIILGLIDDIISHSIIGVTSLKYLLIALIASSNNKALGQQRFNIVWGAFALSLLIVTAVETLAIHFFTSFEPFKLKTIFYCLATILFYPLAHWFYTRQIKWFKTK